MNMFSGSLVSMELSPMVADNVRHQKHKMATAKPEVVTTRVRPSDTGKILYTCFRGRTLSAMISLRRVTLKTWVYALEFRF